MGDEISEKIKNYKTAPFDARFPNLNQTKHCVQNYLVVFSLWKNTEFLPAVFHRGFPILPLEFLFANYHRCQKSLIAKEKDPAPCEWYRRVYSSMCPNSWVEKWDEQREAGTYPCKI